MRLAKWSDVLCPMSMDNCPCQSKDEMTTSRITSEDNVQNGHSVFICRQFSGWKKKHRTNPGSFKVQQSLAGIYITSYELSVTMKHDTAQQSPSLHESKYNLYPCMKASIIFIVPLCFVQWEYVTSLNESFTNESFTTFVCTRQNFK